MAAEHRLPDTVRPEKYSIELRPNLKAFSFDGSESIRIQVARPTKTIALNAEGLEVREATVSSSKGGSRPATSIDFDSKREVLQLNFAESIPSGPATLRLSFSGTLNDDLGDGMRLVRFAETPRMSTYLLAFAVGPLDSIEGKARRGTKLGVWALPDRIGHSRWALDEAIRILDYLNDYYGIPYPLEKLDHIALLERIRNAIVVVQVRSEEHTSELQSHSDLVCRLLLEKKKDLLRVNTA